MALLGSATNHFYRNISASEWRFPRQLFSNGEARQGPLSSASLLCDYALSQVSASGGGDAFPISHLHSLRLPLNSLNLKQLQLFGLYLPCQQL